MRSSERWQKVKKILYPALEMEPAGRSSYLDQACGDDGELRREIESLIAAHDTAEKHLESAAVEMMASVVSEDAENDLSGTSVGHYEVIEKLGAGGMGEVYLARDTHLDRKVALKLLPAFFTQDPYRLRRFQQEARSASALNHPNILTVHDVGNEDSLNFIATEFVDGETLRDRINRAPLTIAEAVDIATQIASALAAAHEAGIVHRDIKPENVMIRRDGIVKVLDFGLAKLAPRPGIDPEASTMVNTGEGIVMGTAQYMSPEQARGLAVDARSDIWSLGCVLYEMLVGRAPFMAPTKGDVIVSILEREPPPLKRYADDLPTELDWLVKKALRKDRDERYQTSKELLSDLRNFKHRFEFEAELERTAPPVGASSEVPARHSSRQANAVTVQLPDSQTTSSAEYVVSGIRKHKTAIAFVLTAILTAAALAAFYYSNRSMVLTEKDSILLTEFVNTTGDPVFDGTLKQAVAVQLGQSPFINIFPDQRVREALRFMERSPDERVTKEIGREICQREGLKAMLTGSIASLGSHYVITLEALNSQTGEALAREQVEAESKEQVLKTLGGAATKLREKLGESLASIQKFDVPIVQATTSSLEALQAFARGSEMNSAGKHFEAIPFFKRAVELDPNFALAYLRLAIAHFNIGEGQLGAEYVERAVALQGRTSEREKFYISYYASKDEIDKAIEVLELWKQTYPRDTVPRTNLTNRYSLIGQWEKAVEEGGEVLRLDPNMAITYSNLGLGFLYLNRFDEARAILEQGVEKKLDHLNLRINFYVLAFVQGDEATMQRQVDWANGKPGEGVLLFLQAHAAAFSGQRRKSQDLFRRSAEANEQHSLKEFAARGQADYALLNANFGDCRQTKESVANALNIARSKVALELSALALALCGETSRAQSLAVELVKRHPKDTLVNTTWLPAIQAALEIKRGNTKQAIQLLQVARRFEMGLEARAMPAYVRGLAYLRGGSGAEAMAEFQRIIDHRGVVGVSALYPLAHLGLARAAALVGETPKSLEAYERFFTLWKVADSDIPILLEARKESESLAK